ncbi:hypothetical protein MMC22_010397 [Lobaria immixta]|nr:hypothetical protein [Lobaria immixta]
MDLSAHRVNEILTATLPYPDPLVERDIVHDILAHTLDLLVVGTLYGRQHASVLETRLILNFFSIPDPEVRLHVRRLWIRWRANFEEQYWDGWGQSDSLSDEALRTLPVILHEINRIVADPEMKVQQYLRALCEYGVAKYGQGDVEMAQPVFNIRHMLKIKLGLTSPSPLTGRDSDHALFGAIQDQLNDYLITNEDSLSPDLFKEDPIKPGLVSGEDHIKLESISREDYIKLEWVSSENSFKDLINSDSVSSEESSNQHLISEEDPFNPAHPDPAFEADRFLLDPAFGTDGFPPSPSSEQGPINGRLVFGEDSFRPGPVLGQDHFGPGPALQHPTGPVYHPGPVFGADRSPLGPLFEQDPVNRELVFQQEINEEDHFRPIPVFEQDSFDSGPVFQEDSIRPALVSKLNEMNKEVEKSEDEWTETDAEMTD